MYLNVYRNCIKSLGLYQRIHKQEALGHNWYMPQCETCISQFYGISLLTLIMMAAIIYSFTLYECFPSTNLLILICTNCTITIAVIVAAT